MLLFLALPAPSILILHKNISVPERTYFLALSASKTVDAIVSSVACILL